RLALAPLLAQPLPPPPPPPLFPYTTLFRSPADRAPSGHRTVLPAGGPRPRLADGHARGRAVSRGLRRALPGRAALHAAPRPRERSEEHTSELQSRFELVCRLLREKQKTHAP